MEKNFSLSIIAQVLTLACIIILGYQSVNKNEKIESLEKENQKLIRDCETLSRQASSFYSEGEILCEEGEDAEDLVEKKAIPLMVGDSAVHIKYVESKYRELKKSAIIKEGVVELTFSDGSKEIHRFK